MLVYRVEHIETKVGPFQSEHYDVAAGCADVSPAKWGKYLPVYDPVNDHQHDYSPQQRRYGCHHVTDIEAMPNDEAELLAYHGWVVRVYEVPVTAVFIAESDLQCVFDFAEAVLQFVYDLLQFVLGQEVTYVPVPS